MMMQALTPPASFFFVRDFSGRESSQRPFKMCFSRWKAVFFLSLADASGPHRSHCASNRKPTRHPRRL